MPRPGRSRRPSRPADPPAGGLSPRDQSLTRVSRLMAENLLPREDGGTPEASPAAADGGKMADISQAAEPGPNPAAPRAAAGTPGRGRNGPGFQALQAVVILLVVVWVFMLGVMVGRGQQREAGWSRDMMAWLEQKTGGGRHRPPLVISSPPRPAPPEAPVFAAAGPPQPPPPAETAPENGGGEGNFAVQTALAHDEDEARRGVEKLRAQGFSAYFYAHPSGRRFAVRAGRFQTRAEAENARQRLAALGYQRPYVSELR